MYAVHWPLDTVHCARAPGAVGGAPAPSAAGACERPGPERRLTAGPARIQRRAQVGPETPAAERAGSERPARVGGPRPGGLDLPTRPGRSECLPRGRGPVACHSGSGRLCGWARAYSDRPTRTGRLGSPFCVRAARRRGWGRDGSAVPTASGSGGSALSRLCESVKISVRCFRIWRISGSAAADG